MTGFKITVIKVLAFAALATVMTIALGVKLANSRLFADTYKLEAAFDDATGVLKGDAVKLAGVDVGRVKGFYIDGGEAIVEFDLDDHIELPKDSTVALRWRNVLGQRFLYVYPGTGSEVFQEGDRIPAENTEDVADIGQLLNNAGPILKAIDPEEANQFLDAVNTALQGNEKDVRRLIDDGAQLAETLAGEDDNIKRLISSADRIMHAFASQDDALGAIFDNLDDVGTVLRRRTSDLNALVTNFAKVQRQLDQLLSENRGNIDSSLDSLDTVARVLKNNRGRIHETLRTMPYGIISYNQTSSWGEWFNVRIVRINVRGQDSQIIADEQEDQSQRPSSGGSPKVGHGANGGYNKDEDGDDREPRGKGKGKGGGRGQEQSSSRSHDDIGAILRFLFLGSEGVR